jgi:hypothetical protein
MDDVNDMDLESKLVGTRQGTVGTGHHAHFGTTRVSHLGRLGERTQVYLVRG